MNLLEVTNYKFNLDRGKVLYNPAQSDEHAVITKRSTFDLSNPDDLEKLQRLGAKYGQELWNEPRSEEANELIKIIPLNSAHYKDGEETKTKQYAHVLAIQVTSGSREDEILYYVIYTNNEKFEWSIDPSLAVKGEEINPEKFSRLPTSIDKSFLHNTKPLAAMNYWQPFYKSKKTSQAVDRIKPSNISGLANKDINYDWINAVRDPSTAADDQKEYFSSEFGGLSNKQKEQYINDYLVRKIESKDRIGLQQINKDVSQVQKLILNSRARTTGKNYMRSFYSDKKKQYLSDLIQPFLDNLNNPSAIYPLVILDSADQEKMMSNVALQDTGSLTSDFFEVIHPIALITGNTTGNAQDMVLQFLGAKSYQELQKKAMISYGGTSTEQLVDSYIYNTGADGQVKKLMISSKSGGGMPAKVRSLKVAYEEVMRNPTAKRLFEKEILNNKDKSYLNTWKFISSIINNDSNYLAAFELAKNFGIANAKDVNLFNQLIQQYNLSADKDEPEDDENDDDEQQNLKEAKEKKVIPPAVLNAFSASVKKAYNSAEANANQVARLVNGIWKTLIITFNSNPAFSNIVSWLFNHSATVQINSHTSAAKNGEFIVNNFVATWPSQAVERAELSIGKTEAGVSVKILINGYQDSFDQASPLSNRKNTNTKFDPRSEYEHTSDWAQPNNVDDDGKVAQLNKLQTQHIKDQNISSIALDKANTWRWAGSNYTLSQMREAGIDEANITKITKYRIEAIKEIEKLKESFNEAKEEDEAESTNDKARVATEKAAAIASLTQLKQKSLKLYDQLKKEALPVAKRRGRQPAISQGIANANQAGQEEQSEIQRLADRRIKVWLKNGHAVTDVINNINELYPTFAMSEHLADLVFRTALTTDRNFALAYKAVPAAEKTNAHTDALEMLQTRATLEEVAAVLRQYAPKSAVKESKSSILRGLAEAVPTAATIDNVDNDVKQAPKAKSIASTLTQVDQKSAADDLYQKQREHQTEEFLKRFVPKHLDYDTEEDVLHWLKREYAQRPGDFAAEKIHQIKNLISLVIRKQQVSINTVNGIAGLLSAARITQSAVNNSNTTDEDDELLEDLSKHLYQDYYVYTMSRIENGTFEINDELGSIYSRYGGVFRFSSSVADTVFTRKGLENGIYSVLFNGEQYGASTNIYTDIDNKVIWLGDRVAGMKPLRSNSIEELENQGTVKVIDSVNYQVLQGLVNTIQGYLNDDDVEGLMTYLKIPHAERDGKVKPELEMSK